MPSTTTEKTDLSINAAAEINALHGEIIESMAAMLGLIPSEIAGALSVQAAA